MAFTFGNNFNDSQPLSNYFVTIVPKFLDDEFKSFYGLPTLGLLIFFNNYYQLTSIIFLVKFCF